MTGVGSNSHSFANYVFLITSGPGNTRTRPEIVRELAVFRGDGNGSCLSFSKEPAGLVASECLDTMFIGVTQAFPTYA